MRRLRKLIGLVLLIGACHANFAFSQSIFKIYKDGKYKAVLIGSSHRNIIDFQSYENQIERYLKDSSYLIIEQDDRDEKIRQLMNPDERFSYFSNLKPSIGDLSKKIDLSCLMGRIDRSTPDKSTQNAVKGLNPLFTFFPLASAAKFQSSDSRNNYKDSVDYFVLNFFEKNKKKIFALEDRDDFIGGLYAIPISEYAVSLNNFCVKMQKNGIEQYTPLNPITNDQLDYVFKNGNENAISHIRDEVVSEWESMGFTELAIHQFLEARDTINSRRIDGYLNKSNEVATVLVGLLHIGGRNGLISNLRKLGYVVKQ